jgi:hypothetical protein
LPRSETLSKITKARKHKACITDGVWTIMAVSTVAPRPSFCVRIISCFACLLKIVIFLKKYFFWISYYKNLIGVEKIFYTCHGLMWIIVKSRFYSLLKKKKTTELVTPKEKKNLPCILQLLYYLCNQRFIGLILGIY